MSYLTYNEAAIDVLTRAEHFNVTCRYETAILQAVLIRPNLGSDVLMRLGVKPSRIFGHTQNVMSEDGTWTSEEEHARQRSLGCEPDEIKNEANAHAVSLGNDYIGPEHQLLAAVTLSSYIREVLTSLYDIDVDKLRSKIIEKQSEPSIVMKKEYEKARRLFSTVDLATDTAEFEHLNRVFQTLPSWEDETREVPVKLRHWHEIRIVNPEEGKVHRDAIIEEFSWISY